MISSVTCWTEAAMSMWNGVSSCSGVRGGWPNSAVELAVGHGQADAVVEVVEVEPERTVGLQVDQLVEDHPGVARLAVGRKPHQLVFARIDLEAGVIGERGVQQPERMGEMDLLDDLEPVVAPERERAGRPLSDAVQRQYRGRGVRRRKKGAGGVAQMMLAEDQALVPVEVGPVLLQLVLQQVLQEQLLPQPDRDRHLERFEIRAARTRGRSPAGART